MKTECNWIPKGSSWLWVIKNKRQMAEEKEKKKRLFDYSRLQVEGLIRQWRAPFPAPNGSVIFLQFLVTTRIFTQEILVSIKWLKQSVK